MTDSASMKEFIFEGEIKLSNARFIICAENINQAREKAKKGDFDDTDTSTADFLDWTIYELSGKENV